MAEGLDAYFQKPGTKLAENENDMLPVVGPISGPSSYPDAEFKHLWLDLLRISEADPGAFLGVQVLIYRLTFFHDHTPRGDKVRYDPAPGIKEVIREIDSRVRVVLRPGGLWGLLNFMDLLAWNEDVKYHVLRGDKLEGYVGRSPRTFRKGEFVWNYVHDSPGDSAMGKRKRIGGYDEATGREGTLLTTINVVQSLSMMIREARSKGPVGPEDPVRFEQFFKVMQHMLRGGGIAPARQYEMLEWFSPYLVR